MTRQRTSSRTKTSPGGSKWLRLAVCLGLFTGGATPVALHILTNNGVDVPGISDVQSLMSMLDQRSPGVRTKGELTKTKRSFKVLSSTSWPELAKTVRPAPAPLTAANPILPNAAPPEVAMLSGFMPGALTGLGVPPVVVGGGGGGPVGGGGGGCCGGGVGGGGGITPTEVPPEVPAVPEPSTWAMLLIGFGAIGTALRRRRRVGLIATSQ